MLVTPLSLTKHASQKNAPLGLIYLYSTKHLAFEGSDLRACSHGCSLSVCSYCAAKGIQEYHPKEGQEMA